MIAVRVKKILGSCALVGAILSLCLASQVLAEAQTNNDCSANGTGTFVNTNGEQITFNGGQISMAGATLFVDFFRTPSSTNDWVDVDGDGFAGFDAFTPPFVDQLAAPYTPGQNLTSWWGFQYRSVGSVNGFNEFVDSQTCHVIPTGVPSEAGIFNGFEYAANGVITNPVSPDNASGTPFQPCEIEGSFLDVPGKWAVNQPGTPSWNRSPSSPGYGLNPILTGGGSVSQLKSLSRTCGTCSVSGDACVADKQCPTGEVCTLGATVALNTNTTAPDADTLFDYVGAWVPVTIISNRGSGVENIKYTEAQHLFTTGRMPNGENLVGATRDVGSGTRNAAMNSLGIDTSWGRGDNLGNKTKDSSTDNLGRNHQPTNKGGSSRMEGAIQNNRLAVGYTGLAGGSRSAVDVQSGKYEILNTCKNVDGDGDGLPDCNCGVDGYVRAGVNTVLDNCDPCNSYQIAGSGSFVVRGNRNANRNPLDPQFESSQPIDNQAIADYLNNIFDSIASFDGSVQPGECTITTTCSINGGACTIDSDCLDFATGETCIASPCGFDSQCPLSSTRECLGGTSNGVDCTADATTCLAGGGLCEPVEVCRLKFNMPGEFLATAFFLPNGLDCIHVLDQPLKFLPTATNQALQDFIRTESVIQVPLYGSVNPAGLVPKRNSTLRAGEYSDGSFAGSYIYFNGSGFTTNLTSGQNLSERNRLQGDFNGDGLRDLNDASELVAAYLAPRTWQQTAVANGIGNTGSMSRDNAIPEVLGDFNGDGNFNKEDLRYFADGLAIVSGNLDRQQGAIAIDNALTTAGQPFPWADGSPQLLIPPTVSGVDPTFMAPADVNDAIIPFLATGKTYAAGDFRADIAGATPIAGAFPSGWDGVVNAIDIDYVCHNIGDWNDLNQAVFMDLSADINGDRNVTVADQVALVTNILGTSLGDANLDGVVDAADVQIVSDTINSAAGCNATQSCGWADGDFNCDSIVDNADLDVVSPTGPIPQSWTSIGQHGPGCLFDPTCGGVEYGQDIPVGGGFSESRSTGVNKIVVVYDVDVDVTNASVTVAGCGVDGFPQDTSGITMTIVPGTQANEAIMLFSPSLPGNNAAIGETPVKYDITINGVERFGGGAAIIPETRQVWAIFGDANSSPITVNNGDLGFVRSARDLILARPAGMQVVDPNSPTGAFEIRSDINNDNTVNNGDLGLVRTGRDQVTQPSGLCP